MKYFIVLKYKLFGLKYLVDRSVRQEYVGTRLSGSGPLVSPDILGPIPFRALYGEYFGDLGRRFGHGKYFMVPPVNKGELFSYRHSTRSMPPLVYKVAL